MPPSSPTSRGNGNDQPNEVKRGMAFRKCGGPDPFTRTVREVYRANVLRSPRADVEPLLALAVIDRKVQPRGALSGLLADDGVTFPEPVTVPVVDLAGLRS